MGLSDEPARISDDAGDNPFAQTQFAQTPFTQNQFTSRISFVPGIQHTQTPWGYPTNQLAQNPFAQ